MCLSYSSKYKLQSQGYRTCSRINRGMATSMASLTRINSCTRSVTFNMVLKALLAVKNTESSLLKDTLYFKGMFCFANISSALVF